MQLNSLACEKKKPYVVVKLAEQSNSLVCVKGILTSSLSWLKREAHNSPQSSTQVNHTRSYSHILPISSRHALNHVQGLHLYANSYQSNTVMQR
jgi:hypothetical protein